MIDRAHVRFVAVFAAAAVAGYGGASLGFTFEFWVSIATGVATAAIAAVRGAALEFVWMVVDGVESGIDAVFRMIVDRTREVMP